MTLHPSGRAARTAAARRLPPPHRHHFVAWGTWGEFGRGNLLAWIDFPVSLAYLHLDGTPLLLWSLAAGGLQWASSRRC